MTSRYRAAVGALLAVSACRQIIGIEKAEVDPELSAAGSGGAMSALEAGGRAHGEAGEHGTPEAGQGTMGGSTGDGAAGDGGAGLAAGQAGASAAPSLCERYCNAVGESCSEGFAVYTSYSVCLAVCNALPEGNEGDKSGNTVHCRLRAAQTAPDEVPHYCPIAGPGGNGVCGTNCEGLCSVRATVCGSGAGDFSSCVSACSALKDLGTYSTALEAAQYSGPHVQCRLYHVSAAAADDTQEHCSHADGAVPCQ